MWQPKKNDQAAPELVNPGAFRSLFGVGCVVHTDMVVCLNFVALLRACYAVGGYAVQMYDY